MQTLWLSPEDADLTRAADLLRANHLVAIPTETVYGLAGNARSDAAVAAIYAAKGRPAHNPLIVHVPDLAAARAFADLGPEAEALAHAFWPGPLTIVAPLRPGTGLARAVTAGQSSVALRVPAHPVALALLRRCGLPLAAPSANPSGKISPTRPQHVAQGLAGKIAAILDGGPCAVGLESSIISTLDGQARLLRAGAITQDQITAILHPVPALAPRHGTHPVSMPPVVPGQMASHYAPNAQIRLDARAAHPGEVWIGFGPDCGDAALNLSPTANLDEAATALFDMLYRADALAGPMGCIAVAPIPQTGIGLAINDRLHRAAAPRPDTAP